MYGATEHCRNKYFVTLRRQLQRAPSVILKFLILFIFLKPPFHCGTKWSQSYIVKDLPFSAFELLVHLSKYREKKRGLTELCNRSSDRRSNRAYKSVGCGSMTAFRSKSLLLSHKLKAGTLQFPSLCLLPLKLKNFFLPPERMILVRIWNSNLEITMIINSANFLSGANIST